MGARGKNPDYQVTIVNNTVGIAVTAELPEAFSLSISSSFDNHAGMASGSAGNAGQTIAGAVGGDLLFRPFTKQIWKGTSPIEFSLALTFDAENNSKQDVHEILVRLASLALPGHSGANSNVFLPPNPTRLSSSTNKTSVRIGRQYYFDDMVVMSATPVSDTRLNAGFPIAGQIDVHFRSEYVYSKEDLFEAASLNYFPGGGSQSNVDVSQNNGGGTST